MIAETAAPAGAVHPESVMVRGFPEGDTEMAQELKAGML
jgi:hypothetical protein